MKTKKHRSASLNCAVALVALCAIVSCSCKDKPTGPVLGPGQFQDASPAWSPDGSWIAFFRGGVLGPSTWGLYKVRSDGSGETRLLSWPASGGILTIDWSDQDWLLVSTHDATVYKVRPDGSGKTVLYGGPGLGASWSPDESRAVFIVEVALWIVDSAGNNAALLDPADSIFSGQSLMPDWGSNGKILHLRYIGNQNDPVIAQIDPLTLQLDILDTGFVGQGREHPRWVSSNSFMFVRYETNKHPQIWQADSAFSAPSCLTCEDVLTEGAGQFSIHSTTGQIVYANVKHGGLSIMDADGTNKRQLTWPEGVQP